MDGDSHLASVGPFLRVDLQELRDFGFDLSLNLLIWAVHLWELAFPSVYNGVEDAQHEYPVRRTYPARNCPESSGRRWTIVKPLKPIS